jgi:L-2-hydroxyglutarate oxidase LhgO
MPPPHIIIIGAGPGGLATGIELLRKGHKVTILDKEKASGQGISKRPPESPYAIAHTGIYNEPGSLKEQYCRDTHQRMSTAPDSDDKVMQIYRKNSVKTGKIIIAKTAAGHEKLKNTVSHLQQQNTIRYNFLETPEAIDALGERFLGRPENIAAALQLPDVGVINIEGYISGLQKAFIAHGGIIKYEHNVTGFKPPTAFSVGTVVECKGQEPLIADLVINMSGLGMENIAQKARKALIQSGHPESLLPTEPEIRYFRMYGVHAPEAKTSTMHVVYNVENDQLSGTRNGIGMHTYPSAKNIWGFAPVLGPLSEPITREEALERRDYFKPITPEIVTQVQHIFPYLDSMDLVFTPLGYRSISITNGKNDFCETRLVHSRLKFCVLNAYYADSPAIASGPVIAKKVAESAQALLATQRQNAQLPSRL